MRLGLLPAHHELKRTAERLLAGAVDTDALRIRQTSAAPAPAEDMRDFLAGLWRGEEPLFNATLIAEEAGRVFAPVSPRPALLVDWLARHSRLGGAGSLDAERTAVSIAGDGTAEDMPVVDGGSTLTGECLLVEDTGRTEALLTLARTNDGPSLFLVPLDQPGVERLERDRLDPTRPAFGVRLSAPAIGRRIADPAVTASLLPDFQALGRLLVAAEMLGIADLLLRLATGYARSRTQFGATIGSFQAISHACADILCEIELLRSLVYAAAAAPTAASVPAHAMAARAKALAADAGPRIANRTLQIFGGEGLTWERGLHFALRRQQALRVTFGHPEQCFDEVAECLL